MRLNPDFITQDVAGTRFLVPLRTEPFNGIARGNKTAAFILDCLKDETTEAQIVDAVCRKYEVAGETAAADVARILATLRKIGALAE